jgi:hypothetical protein
MGRYEGIGGLVRNKWWHTCGPLSRVYLRHTTDKCIFCGRTRAEVVTGNETVRLGAKIWRA